jgi:hypothetical protein
MATKNPASGPDETLVKLCELLKSVCESQGNADDVTRLRQWFLSPDFDGDLLDPAVLAKAGFERGQLNAAYLKLYRDATDIGAAGEFIAAKQQIDYIAAAERAFRYRHCSVPRALAHTSARRAGLADSPVISNVPDSIAKMLRAATEVPNNPQT